MKNITQQSQKGWGKGLKEDTLKIYKYRDFTGSQVVKTAIVAQWGTCSWYTSLVEKKTPHAEWHGQKIK